MGIWSTRGCLCELTGLIGGEEFGIWVQQAVIAWEWGSVTLALVADQSPVKRTTQGLYMLLREIVNALATPHPRSPQESM